MTETGLIMNYVNPVIIILLCTIIYRRERGMVRAIKGALAFLEAGEIEYTKKVLRQLINQHYIRKHYAN
jgi:riboflavin transporter FmnP